MGGGGVEARALAEVEEWLEALMAGLLLAGEDAFVVATVAQFMACCSPAVFDARFDCAAGQVGVSL